MPKNNNIQTVSDGLDTKSSHIVIGSMVPAGLTRYVTMLKVTQTTGVGAKGSRVLFCSGATTGAASNVTAGSTIQKLSVVIPSALISAAPTSAATPLAVKSRQIPAMPDSENPLFSIAESKYLSAVLSSVTGFSAPVNIFAQYYEQ